MKLPAFLKRKTRETKASRTAPLLVTFDKDQPRFTPRQYDRLAEEGYQKNVIAYRCVRLIAQSAASVPWILFSNKTRMEDHPLLGLLTRPNPVQRGAELFEAIYSYFLIAGNAYVEALGPDASTIKELWTLRPDRMRVVAGRDGVPKAYRYLVHGKHMDFAVDPLTGKSAILHAKTFHPLDDWYGMSPLEAAAFSIDQHNDAAKWNASLLQNSGRPSGALIYKPAHSDAPDVLSDTQRQNIRSELEDYFQGRDNAGRPIVLEGGLDWKDMGLSPKDMDWLAGKNISARDIAQAYNVPPQLIGVDGSLTFANFEQARLSLYDEAILPLLDHFKDELNAWLVPQFGQDLRLDYDLDAIEALSPRREKTWARINEAAFMTVNEKRAAVGLSPVADGDRL